VLRIDHVILAVGDLDEAGQEVLRRYGLASVPGGRHPGWGTGNRIVPLGPNYLELMGVVDREEAQADPFGAQVVATVAHGDRLMGWCVATSDLQSIAQRLGLEISAGSRVLPDGQVLRWRAAGMDDAVPRRSFPFFITWDVPPELHPGRARADHRVAPLGLSRVEVSGSRTELMEWLDGEELPVLVREGPDDLVAVVVATADGGEIRLTG
jgi:hypothetical protein